MPSHLERLRSRLRDALAGATAEAMLQAPPGKWNSEQILEHLLLSYTATTRGLEKCVEKGSPCATHSTLQQRLATVVLINFGYFPDGAKSPPHALPRGMAPQEVRSVLFAEIDRMESAFDDCERHFGAATKIMDHPILGPLTVEQWRKFHFVHGRHHARQIRQRLKLRQEG